MHGNELSKASRTAAAVSVLHDAIHTARHDDERAAALALGSVEVSWPHVVMAKPAGCNVNRPATPTQS